MRGDRCSEGEDVVAGALGPKLRDACASGTLCEELAVGNAEREVRSCDDDSSEETAAYVRAIAADPGLIDVAVSNQWIEEAPRAIEWLEDVGAIVWEIIPEYPDYYHPEAQGSRPRGRYLTAAAFPGRELGVHRPLLYTTPHFPLGVSYEEIFRHQGDKERLAELVAERSAADILSFGTAIAAHLLRGVLRRGIPLHLEHRAVELVQSAEGVAGVRCECKAGNRTFMGAVVLATGTYDWDPELVRAYSGLEPDESGSVAPPTLRGDAIHLARQVGADVFALPPGSVPHVPGYVTALRGPGDNGFRGSFEYTFPHCFIVNRHGVRFCDDAAYQSVAHAVLDDPTRHNTPFFLIWDEQHHRKYGMRPGGPGEPYPPELGVASARTLRELADSLGIDGDRLEATAERFNAQARKGVDTDFGRGAATYLRMFRGDASHGPNPLLGPVEEAPFHGMQLRMLGTAIGAAGVRTGRNGQALDERGDPVPGLYAIGAASALTTSGTGYNSGFSISRALTFGILAIEDVHARRLGAASA